MQTERAEIAREAPGAARDTSAAPTNGLVVTVYRSLSELPAPALQLIEEAPNLESQRGLAWFRLNMQTAMSRGHQPFIYVVTDAASGAPLVILPLRTLTPSRLRLRPHGPQSLQATFTPQCHPIVAGSLTDPVPALQALFAHIVREPHVDGIKLAPIAEESPMFDALARALRGAGLVVMPSHSFVNWTLDVAGRSADEYFGGLPARLSNTIRRKTASFNATGTGEIRVISGAEGLEAAIVDCEQVYRRGWQAHHFYPAFDTGLMRACAVNGWLRLGLLYIDGQPAAAQFWIVNGDTALIFSLAFDDQFAKSSPGTVLMTRMMRHVIDIDRVARVDFLRGDDAYKREWMSTRRERWDLIALTPRTVRGLLGIVRHTTEHVLLGAAWICLTPVKAIVRRLRSAR